MNRLRTPLCARLEIEHPIFCAPMGAGMAGPALVAAVSNAGGCGILGAGALPAPLIRAALLETRKLTSRPFGAGLLLPLLQGGELEALLESPPAFLVLFWGDVAPHVARAARSGVPVYAQIGSVDEARAAVDAGAAGVIAQGVEAGGHVRGTRALAALLPEVVAAIAPRPVIAAGGIGDGAGIAAALALGAQGASLGTRFAATLEAAACEGYKQRLVAARAEDTVYTEMWDVGWPNAPHRALRNAAYDEWERAGRPRSGARPGEGVAIGTMQFGSQSIDVPRYSVLPPLTGFQGDLDRAVLYAGESVERTHDVPSAGELVRRLVGEAERALA